MKNNRILGIELGSTRIKAILIDGNAAVLAQGSYEWENILTDGLWSYPIEQVTEGVQAAYAALAADYRAKFGEALTEISAFDVIQNLFPEKNRDFVININETDIAVVKELRTRVESRDLEKLAQSIADTLGSEFYTPVSVGIGTPVAGIKELARSFKEAQISLEVGKVFDTEKAIVSYDHLGIARLIYQLPTTLCDMFLREVFKNGSMDSLDQETLFTIQRFFENNLNVSETSRRLFVHRNTLVYRLEKIKRLTGLDLREFDDAIVFKVAMMVKKYLTADPVKY